MIKELQKNLTLMGQPVKKIDSHSLPAMWIWVLLTDIKKLNELQAFMFKKMKYRIDKLTLRTDLSEILL